MTESFFSMFTPKEIAHISATGTRVHLPEGWSPIWEDTPPDKAYIILDGTVSVRRDKEEIAQCGPGDIIGEAAIMRGSLRTASIVALTPLDLIHLSADKLQQLSVEMPTFARALDKVAKERFGS